MNIEELKHNILNDMVSDNCLVFQYSDDNGKFLANHYIKGIAKSKHLEIKTIESLEEITNYSINCFEQQVENIFVLDTPKLITKKVDFSSYKNTIIICKTIDVASNVKDYLVSLPSPDEKQILEYMQARVPGLDSAQLRFLKDACKNSLFKIDGELSKYQLFDTDSQSIILENAVDEGFYKDFSSASVFNLLDAIKKKDVKLLGKLLDEIEFIDFEPYSIITLLHNELIKIIYIKRKKIKTDEDFMKLLSKLNINKYFYTIYAKDICLRYTDSELINLLRYIDELDFKIKTGNMTNIVNDKAKFIDFLLCDILSK